MKWVRNILQCFYKENSYIYSMENKERKQDALVKVPEKGFLTLVAEKLKDRDLFPEKTEEAKVYLNDIVVANPQ